MWRSVTDLGYSRVARYFESLKLTVGRRLMSLYAEGAVAAAEMLGGGGDDGAAGGCGALALRCPHATMFSARFKV